MKSEYLKCISYFILVGGFALTCLCCSDSFAKDNENSNAEESKVKTYHALAMHGEPKYPRDFTHFEYVNPDAPKGGTLRMYGLGTFDSLNPFILKGIPASGIGELVYNSLMNQSLDEPFTMYGALASSFEMPEDRSWIIFNIREQARWHDGTPVTAQDVKWSFEFLLEHGRPFYRAYYSDIEKVEILNDKKVKFVFADTDNAELPLIAGQMSIFPSHYWNSEDRDFSLSGLEFPLGSGPYKVKEVNDGKSIVFERVKDWWGESLPVFKGKYNFDEITYDYYRDSNVAFEAFLGGKYDVRLENTAKIWATSYVSPALDSGEIVKEVIKNKSPAGMQAFLYNIRRPVFQDQAVRKALSYAFDFEWSNKQFAHGEYVRTDSYFENSDYAADEGKPQGRVLEILEQYKDELPVEVFEQRYEPPKADGKGNNRENLRIAANILDQAGWVLGEDGIRKKDGVKLEFEILDNNPAFERWVLPFKGNLEKLGVIADFRIVDSAQYKNRLDSYDFDMTIGVIPQSSSPGNEQIDFWHSSKADVKGSRNYIGIKNPVVDDLVAKIVSAHDQEELVNSCKALDRVLLSYDYVVPHWHINYWRIARWNYIKRPEISADYSPAIVSTWWYEK